MNHAYVAVVRSLSVVIIQVNLRNHVQIKINVLQVIQEALCKL